MKVLHVTNAYPIEKHVSYGIFIKEQIDSLIELGIECDVCFINSYEKGIFEYLRSVKTLINKIKNYDLIHCHHPYSFIPVLISNFTKKPVVTSFMGAYGSSDNNSFVSNFVNRFSDAVLTKINNNNKINNKNSTYYIPNGVNMIFFDEQPKEKARKIIGIDSDNTIYVLFCSAGNLLRPVKRYDLYKKVIDILNEKHNNIFKELLIVNVNRELIPYYLNSANLHLLTSDFEGSPNSVKEALACNIPVVSTDVGNVRDILSDINGCYVSQRKDPYEIAELVLLALKNKRIKGREALIKKGLDMKSVAVKILNMYDKVIKKNIQS